jgi:ATP-dependent DNA ligase
MTTNAPPTLWTASLPRSLQAARRVSRLAEDRVSFWADQIAAALDVDDAILDGEVIAADETGRPLFYDLLRDTRTPAYVAFDVIWLNGAELRPLPLIERRQHLQNILPNRSAIISEPLSVRDSGHKLFELTCDHDLEGVVAKRLKDGYGPSVRWLKIKNPGYSQNEGRREFFDRSAGVRLSPDHRPR